MKNIFKYITIILGLAAFSGCSDFLEENNPSGLQTIYNTPNDLEAATKGVFASLWSNYGIGGEMAEFMGPGSGLTHWGRTNRATNNQWISLLKFTSYSASKYNGMHLLAMFKGITSANNLLANLSSSPVEESLKLEAEAETKFYRAVIYFWLVRVYGDIPIHTEALTAKTASNSPRDPYYKVYMQIIKDLEFAEQNMRSPERAREMSPTYPRPNKYAATAYLASVYNTIGSLLASPDDNYWNPAKEGRKPDFTEIGFDLDPAKASQQAYKKALEYAEKLIPGSATHDSGCTYKLRERFGDLFKWDTNYAAEDGQTAFINDEQILVLPNTITTGQCLWIQYSMPDYAPGTNLTATNSQRCRNVCTRWMFDTWCNTYPGTKSTSGDYYLTSSDPRLDKSFFYGKVTLCTGASATYYPAKIARDNFLSFPFFKKFAGARTAGKYGDADYIFMRFAEVYFIAAEAAAATGDEAKAVKYINVIHARARHSVDSGKPDSAEPADWTVGKYTGQELLDKIFWEWAFEFIGENFEYHNVHRHGASWIVRNISIPKNAFFDTVTGQNLFHSSSASSNFYPMAWRVKGSERYSTDPEEVRKGLLFAYPSNEILYNSGLTQDSQNDYWYGL